MRRAEEGLGKRWFGTYSTGSACGLQNKGAGQGAEFRTQTVIPYRWSILSHGSQMGFGLYRHF